MDFDWIALQAQKLQSENARKRLAVVMSLGNVKTDQDRAIDLLVANLADPAPKFDKQFEQPWLNWVSRLR